jgi:hypothetical protein
VLSVVGAVCLLWHGRGLTHALAVAEAMGRTLVLPQLMTLRSQAELESLFLRRSREAGVAADVELGVGVDERWEEASYFLNVSALQRHCRHGVITTRDFLRMLADEQRQRRHQPAAEPTSRGRAAERLPDAAAAADDDDEGDRVLRAGVVHPPYLVPRADPRRIYDGAYFRRLGLRWHHGTPHPHDRHQVCLSVCVLDRAQAIGCSGLQLPHRARRFAPIAASHLTVESHVTLCLAAPHTHLCARGGAPRKFWAGPGGRVACWGGAGVLASGGAALG